MAFKSLLDPNFKYRNSVATDVRATFERIRREQNLTQRRVQNETSVRVVGRIAAIR